MQRSEEIAKLATALAKAQGAIEDAEKDSLNPHFKARYADLAAVRRAVRKPLADNAISVIQLPRSNGDYVEVETILLHESGEFIGETLTVPLAVKTPQGLGSALSYARRYSLMSILGVAASDDDDAEGAMVRSSNGPPPKPPAKTAPAKLAANGHAKPNGAAPVEAAEVVVRREAREKAKEGTKTFNEWYHALNDAQADAVDAIGEELIAIANKADEWATQRNPIAGG